MSTNDFLDGMEHYRAEFDDTGKIWRILDLWHQSLKGLTSEDDVPDESPAVTILTEGAFIALMKEAGSLGLLSSI